jgi:carotenoid 1,2-hydratase
VSQSFASADPDRFFNRTTPGAHEWWYFDAISGDGRDAIVIVFYAGLPFDPSYGVATLRHLKNPSKYPQPMALDHSAIGFSWYRDGKAIAYALNATKAEDFRHEAEPFSIEIATNRLERDSDGYRLTIATNSVEGQRIRGEFRFRPASATEPFERNLGTPEAPHNWILVASDCQVSGSASFLGEDHLFEGRGYHDHNAGAEDLSVAMKRWEWGRFHHGTATEIYYVSEPREGPRQSLWITTVNGRPESILDDLQVSGDLGRTGNIYGVRHARSTVVKSQDRLMSQMIDLCVDDGPFYRRWLAEFNFFPDVDGSASTGHHGIAELLDTRNLHKPWFNWMIPYRLKWPKT